jgi:hypothetical protein
MLKLERLSSIVAALSALLVPVSSSAQAHDNLNVTVSSSSLATGVTTLSVIDPGSADKPLLQVDLPTAVAKWAKTSGSTVLDVATRKVQYIGELEMHFIRDSRLYLADTRSATPSAVQVSSEAALCDLLGQWPWRIDGSGDLSIIASTAGADGDCATAADNGIVALRASMDTNTAAVPMPSGIQAVAGLYAHNLDPLQWQLYYDTQGRRLRLFSRTGSEEGSILGPNRNIDGFVTVAGPDPLAPSAIYLCDDSSLYHLAWNERGARLTPVYRFASAFCDLQSFTHDSEHTWFSDNKRLLRLRGSGPPVVQQDFNKEISQLEHTPTRLLVGLRGFSTSAAVYSTPKLGGAVTRLATASPGGYDLVIVPSLTHTVTLYDDNIEFYGIDRVFVVSDDGTRTETVLNNVEVVGRTFADVTTHQIRHDTGLIFCGNADFFNSCAGFVLGQLDLSGKAVTLLGRFPAVGKREVTGGGTIRHPLSFSVSTSGGTEAWLAEPGGEESLMRVAPPGPP